MMEPAVEVNQLTIEQRFHLGLEHHHAGRLAEAEGFYRVILSEDPNHAHATHLLGVIALQAGRTGMAVDLLRRAIALNPNSPEANNNLGHALRDLGQLDQAVEAFRRAIVLKSDLPDPYNNLGNALIALGQLDQAVAACRQAIALRPNYPEAYSNLGNALRKVGQLEQSTAACRQAITLNPNLSEAHNNLGNALCELGRLDRAIHAYRQAILLKPNFPEALNNLGNALKASGCVAEAIAQYEQALKLEPHSASIHSNLVYTLCFDANGDRRFPDEAREWDRRHALPLRATPSVFSNVREPEKLLRIGYVSPNFGDHVVGRNVLPLLRNHDRRQFEVFCYSVAPHSDRMTRSFQACAQIWREMAAVTDENAARQVRSDGIDILIDLALHLAGNRLLIFAQQSAPVQVSFAGYPSSTGLQTIGYRISDIYLDPPGSDAAQVEKTICLPHSFWCYDPLDSRDVRVGELPALANGFVTFGCLNNYCKINLPTLELWAKVLSQTPGSRLLMLADDGSHRGRTLQILEGFGVQSSRVQFVCRCSHRDYLRLYDRIDIGLDSFPYNGHTTSLDSLWMGVPVLTLVGNTPVARAGWSQLSNLKLTELAAQSPGQFVQIAAALARDLPRLATLRSSLRHRMEASPLMDAQQFTRGIESAYRTIWRNWCRLAK
jgi:predicted O-linked N-acetylglucosamine transferase (SPINDLY family)